MLIYNGKEWVQFVGSRPVQGPLAEPGKLEPCVDQSPLGNHDRVAFDGARFMPVLREFIADPNARFVGNDAMVWRKRLSDAAGCLNSL